MTSNDAGLSVPDWPLSYNSLMPPMVGGIVFEHTHRMIAATVGLMAVVLALWLWRRDERRAIRRLGAFAVAAVMAQAILGGITVLFFLPPAVSIFHASLAQIFFCTTVVLALVTSPLWRAGSDNAERMSLKVLLFPEGISGNREASAAAAAVAVIFFQLLLGSAVRHLGMVGGSKGVQLVVPVLLAHLAGAAAVTILVIRAAVRLAKASSDGHMQRLAALMLGLLGSQLFLGWRAYLVRASGPNWSQPFWSGAVITTAHVAVGAILLAVTLLAVLQSVKTNRQFHQDRLSSPRDRASLRNKAAAYLELTKPRVTLLVVLTAAAGVYLASASVNAAVLVHVMAGTALLSGGTAVLNEFLERDADARMRRTERRPLPSGRIDPAPAMIYGMVLIFSGTAYLAAFTNLLTAVIGCLTSIIYLFIYTPLKTRTSLCTFVGAFPGAAPALMGWSAVGAGLDERAWVLFLILFLWQFPHFLAISWLYREDYARGGFIMLPLIDNEGKKTGRRIMVFTFSMVGASVLPSLVGLAGSLYLIGALLLGMVFMKYGVSAAMLRTQISARHLLRISVIYLPLLLTLMMVDKR
ncbi:MAG: protoheme IX farnesyltransferase [Acidobacteria bacterium]|nr:protoheme IX farnesyltransferase [Acidobacteriota bacterium]